MFKNYILFFIAAFFFFPKCSFGQLLPPNQPEQDACNALLMCGNSFTTPYSYQGTGQILDISTFTCPCSSPEANSCWFRLEITSPGIIVFEIQPLNIYDDYDFAVVDITNKACDSFVSTDIIRCNFNNNQPVYNNGILGLNTTSTQTTVSGGTTGNSYLQEITASAGDVYLIMVNNWGTGSGPASGFTIDFTGSTATFNQAPAPKFDKVIAACNHSQDITIQLTQNVLCSSIASDASDFYLTPTGTIQSVEGLNCTGTAGYTNKIKLTFNGTLGSGDYVLHARTGTDTNTLLGLCGAELALPDSLKFHVGADPLSITSIDSPACQTLTLHINAPGECGSIAANGSDFTIVGPSAVNIAAAEGVGCTSPLGYTQTIRLTLSAPIAVDGLYYVKVQNGSDGNTFEDSCGRVLPVNEQIPFVVNSFNGQLDAHPDDTLICNVGTMIPLYGENNGIPPNNGFQYQWTPVNGIQNPNAMNTSVIVPDSLNNYVLSTIDSNGCYLRDSIHIRAENFHANFDYTVNLGCEKDTVYFQNSTTPGATGYYWQFGDGQTDTTFEPSHLYVQGGYMVMLTATNGYCTDSVLHSVSLNHPLVADFTVSPDTLCMGGIVTFTNNSTATTSNGINPGYTWDFGDGTGDTTLNPDHQYPNPGTYTVTLIAQNFISCMDTAYHVVRVDSMPGLSFTASSSQICKGDHITFNASYVNSGLQSLAWNFGYNADTIYNLNPVQASYEEPGTYTVTLHGDYAVCPDTTFSVDITVNSIPVINLGADTSICLNGQPIILKDNINASNPAARWLWNTGDTTASIEVKHEGIYTSRVTIANCTAEDEVDIKKDCYIDIPNSFTPNNDGHNDYFWPRQLLSEGVLQFNMSIFNRWGEKIFDTQNPKGRGWDGNFNGKTQPTGVYVYTMELMLKNGKTEHYSGNVTLLR